MKALKKLSCVLLVVLLMLSLSTTAFAAGGTGSIAVEKAILGTTYTAYRILDFVPVDADDTTGQTTGSATVDGTLKGVYTPAKGWAEFFEEEPASNWFKLDGIEGADKYVTLIDGAVIDPRALADAAVAYAKEHSADIDEPLTMSLDPLAEGLTGTDDDRTSFKWENVPLGYYVVDSTAGALVSLDTAGVTVTMFEKNNVPTINKEVKEGENWGDRSDAEHNTDKAPKVGDRVEYRTTITVRTGGTNYVLHDKMAEGLTFDTDSVKVQIGEDVVTEDGNYNVDLDPEDKDTFDVTFTDAYISSLADGTKIVVYYTATINSDAEVNQPERNDTYLSFGDDNETVHDHTDTYTYQLNIFKYIGSENPEDAKQPLKDAKFVLSKKDGEKDVYACFTDDWLTSWEEATVDEDGKITYPAGSEMITDEKGTVPAMKGLDTGTYTLTETEAPAGYNKADPFTVVIDHDGKATANDAALDEANTVNVPNYTGLELPETGGIGTTIFYTVGGVLVAVALILLVTKKRMSKEA